MKDSTGAPLFTVLSFGSRIENNRELNVFRCEATVKVRVGKRMEHRVSEGKGPINALDLALRKALEHHYPELELIKFRGYKVSVLYGDTNASVRVTISFTDGETNWSGEGISHDIVEASFNALVEGFHKGILKLSPVSL